MLRHARASIAMLGVLAVADLGPRPPPKETLLGAWSRAAESLTAPDTSWTRTTGLQPSLYIFVKRHYSIMFVPGTQPRKLFAGREPTDAEKIAAFDSFVANSGTYALKDSSLIIRPIVARVPDFMAGGTGTLAYRIRGDSLWLPQRFPWARDTTKTAEFRTTLVRLE